MIPCDFPESNVVAGVMADYEHESHVRSLRAYVGTMDGGPLDGVDIVVTAWKPTLEELARLNSGAPVFLSCIGGLPPHFLCTTFEAATTPRG